MTVTLFIVAVHLYTGKVRTLEYHFPTMRACQVAMTKVITRTHRITKRSCK